MSLVESRVGWTLTLGSSVVHQLLAARERYWDCTYYYYHPLAKDLLNILPLSGWWSLGKTESCTSDSFTLSYHYFFLLLPLPPPPAFVSVLCIFCLPLTSPSRLTFTYAHYLSLLHHHIKSNCPYHLLLTSQSQYRLLHTVPYYTLSPPTHIFLTKGERKGRVYDHSLPLSLT